MTGSLSTAALLTGTTAGVVALLALGLARAARRAGLAHPRTLAASVAVGLIVWLGATAALAQSGVLADWTALPPRWPLLPLTALGTFVLLGLTRTFRRLLAEVPPWQPVALQTFRVGVELAFWRLHAGGSRARPGHVRGAELRRARRPHGPGRGGRDRVRLVRAADDDRLEPVRPGDAGQRDRDRRHVHPRPAPPQLAGRAVHRDRRLAGHLDSGAPRPGRDLPPRRLDPPGALRPAPRPNAPDVAAVQLVLDQGG